MTSHAPATSTGSRRQVTTFDLPDAWVWDFWLADDDTSYHLFFLHAPRSLGDPEMRHHNASVGHAVSTDLRTWTRIANVLPRAEPGDFDDLAAWTGSVTRGDDGRWRLFYTGISHRDHGRVQRIGLATSDDLDTWRREPDVLLTADSRWYGTQRAPGQGPAEAWRDPWVCRDSDGTWHMYLSARAGHGPGDGLVGHAVSADLAVWHVRPPLSRPTGRFDFLEVIQVLPVDGRWVALFSCASRDMPHDRSGSGGVWTVPVSGPGAPIDAARAVRLTDEDLFAGKVVTLRDGTHRFLAFQNLDAAGNFLGGLVEPLPVSWNSSGTGLTLDDTPAGSRR